MGEILCMESFPICQVVGYKSSGKTTLMQQLIRYYSTQNLQVGTLKHHGHGGEPEQIKTTDSYQHLMAGSAISAVQGERELHLTVNDSGSVPLKKLIQFYTIIPIDILLIEGYKKMDYRKIILINGKQDLHLLEELSNIIAVGSWDHELIKTLDYFTFSLSEIDFYLTDLTDIALGRKKHG